MILINKILQKLKKFYHLKILKKKYYRLGECHRCGACCQNIYVRHNGSIISSEEEFKEIQKTDSYPFYKYIEVISKDDFGLVFSCTKFDKEKKLCTIHKSRPSICRNYPSEEIFSFGAQLQDNCGYSFEPIQSFEEIFKKVSKHKVKDFKEFQESDLENSKTTENIN